jgi:hypothetical protein
MRLGLGRLCAEQFPCELTCGNGPLAVWMEEHRVEA